MNPQAELKLTRMKDEIHLISTPVRIAADWLKMLVFILVLPIVFIVSVVDWLVTGAPIMSADEIWLTKVLLTVLSPWITTFLYLFRKHWRAAKGRPMQKPVPSGVIFVGTISIFLILVRCNFYLGWSFYSY